MLTTLISLISLISLWLTFSPSSLFANQPEPDWLPSQYSILQGSTSDSVTHFTVVAHESENLVFTAENAVVMQPSWVERKVHPGSEWVVYRLRFEGLQPSRDYQLKIRNAVGQLQELRRFQTLDVKRPKGKVAIASCMLRQMHNPMMWRALEKEAPDLILMIGDAVYLDRDRLLWPKNTQSTLQAWESYVRMRQTLGVYRWEKLVPTLSVWDDHDAGGDNVTAADFGLMPSLAPIYETFFANDAIDGFLTEGPGQAKQFVLYGKNFVMLDDRTWRDLHPRFPLLGEAQELWMRNQLQPGDNFIIASSQFYGGGNKKDSMEFNWPNQALTFTRDLRAAADRVGAQLVFFSGDIHFSEVQALEKTLFGYPTFEVTSSPAHSSTYPGRHFLHPNSRRIMATATHNVVLAEFSASRKGELGVRALGWSGRTLFEKNLVVGACDEALGGSLP